MTTYAFPSITPTSSTWELVSNVGVHRSPLSGATQTLDRGGEHWRCHLNFSNLTGADAATMRAFLVKLNGQQQRFTVHDPGQPQRGAFGGSAAVRGASQTGTSINIDEMTASVTNWIRTGDHFSIDGHLKMATADFSSNGSGRIDNLTFAPRIVTAPANNADVDVTSPTCIFMLASSDVGWSKRRGDFSDFSIVGIEDVLA